MADQLDINRLTAFDASGDPLSGAKAYFFESGTSTPVTVYSDAALSVAHPSPLVADSSGVFAPVFYGAAPAVKVRVETSAGVEVYTSDPVRRVTGEGAAASAVSFAPTTEIPVSNVQAAIERVQANASITFNVVEKTANYTVVAADKTRLIRCTTALTISLTAAATLGDGFFFAVEADGGAVTITSVGALADGEWALIWCDGSNFFMNKAAAPLDQSTWNDGTSTTEALISPEKLKKARGLVQRVRATLGTVSTTTATIPQDNTLPQNTEGTEVITVTITPTDAANDLIVRGAIQVSVSAQAVTAAVFRDSGADAILGSISKIVADGNVQALPFCTTVSAGSTAATTFKVRVGTTGGTLTINGEGGSGLFGGALLSEIVVEEVNA